MSPHPPPPPGFSNSVVVPTAHPLSSGAAAVPGAVPGALHTAVPGVPPAVATPLPVMVQSPVAAHFGWLTHGLAGIFILASVALVVLLALQTTKQEGLTGSIGGRVESAYRGRLGADEQLKRITGMVAVAFVVTAFILSLTGI
jgi:preprotein translocase subunit SecG